MKLKLAADGAVPWAAVKLKPPIFGIKSAGIPSGV